MIESTKFEPPPLTHRFTALYLDGSQFTQPMDDVSKTREGGSAFTDVKLDELRAFFLESGTVENDLEKHLYMVDLVDGHFEIDGVAFALGPEVLTGPFKLVYFRRISHSKESRVRDGHVVQKSTRWCYHLGWETPEGVQRTIEVGHGVLVKCL